MTTMTFWHVVCGQAGQNALMGAASSRAHDEAHVYASAKRGVIVVDGVAAFVGLCAGGHARLAKALANRIDKDETFALAAAVRGRHTEIVHWLLGRGQTQNEILVALSVARAMRAASAREAAPTMASDLVHAQVLACAARKPNPRAPYWPLELLDRYGGLAVDGAWLYEDLHPHVAGRSLRSMLEERAMRGPRLRWLARRPLAARDAPAMLDLYTRAAAMRRMPRTPYELAFAILWIRGVARLDPCVISLLDAVSHSIGRRTQVRATSALSAAVAARAQAVITARGRLPRCS